MNALQMARKEFEETLFSRVYQGFLAVFLLAVVGVHVAGTMEGWTVDDLFVPLALMAQVVLPLGAFAVAHSAVSEERRTGSVKLLMGLPLTRVEVYFGKLLGVALAVSLIVVLGFVVAAVLMLALAGVVPVGLPGFAMASLALALASTGLALGLSTLWTSRKHVLAALAGIYGFMLVWRGLIGLAYLGMAGWEAWPEEEGVNAWFVLLERLNPLEAYTVVADAFVTVNLAPLPQDFGYIAHESRTVTADRVLSEVVPFYVTPEFTTVLLLMWLIVPVLGGYVIFSRVDL